MNPEQYDVFDVNAKYRNADYRRPSIVVRDVFEGRVTVALLSSAVELYKGPPNHFKIESTEIDFKATGLTKDSFASALEYVEIDVSLLLRKRGRLEGELLARFEKWIK